MIRSFNQSRADYSLQISGMTWKKRIQDLFDYDENSPQNFVNFKKNIPTKQAYFYVFRDRATLQIDIQLKKKLKMLKKCDFIQQKELLCACKVISHSKKLEIKMYQPDQVLEEDIQQQKDKKRQKQLQNKKKDLSLQDCYTQYYLIVRSLKDKQKQPIGHILSARDIIKLGQCEFFIHSISIGQVRQQCFKMRKSSHDDILQTEEVCTFFVSNNQVVYDSNLEPDPIDIECKYCMLPAGPGQDEFLCSPCKCSGSCGLVHFSCLVKWNQQKVKKYAQSKGCVQYNFDKFFCEMCKQQYPQYIKKGTKIFELMTIETPTDKDYMVLESFVSSKRHIIVIEDYNGADIRFGRGVQCQVKIDSPSLSRRHAIIRKVKDQYILFDQKSRFGTLVRHPSLHIPLTKENKVSIQSGPTVLSFKLETCKQLNN